MSLSTHSKWTYLGTVFAIAVIYIVTARIGQLFAIPPGNITPVWIPSGIMLALAIILGPRIWPGVFLGAFIGNAWAYMEFSSLSTFLAALLSGTANGLGDVLASVGAVWLMQRDTDSLNPFGDLCVFRNLLLFGVLLGPMSSAVFGVSSLTLAGFVDGNAALLAFVTWWLGDSVGVLLIAPVILAFYFTESRTYRIKAYEPPLLAMLFVVISGLYFFPAFEQSLLPNPSYLIIPVFFWLLIRFDFSIAFLATFVHAAILVYATINAHGPFAGDDMLAALINLDTYIILVSGTVFFIGVLIHNKDRLARQLRNQAETDDLTHIYNRRYFNAMLQQEISRSARSQSRFSLVMFDIDYFKQVNDAHGHGEGDRVLQAVAGLVSAHLRSIDTFARWGGEEFIILLPETRLQGACQLAEKLRENIADHDFGLNQPLTISLGVIEVQNEDMDSILGKLDAALYASKDRGRNQYTSTQDCQSGLTARCVKAGADSDWLHSGRI